MRPLLSIVVPTKDRFKYLNYLISLLNIINSDNVEIIIQDNSIDNSEILNLLKDTNYKFIKYFHVKNQLSICENADLSILNSSGEYVCFIGDDDGVTAHIIDCVKWMKEMNIDVLVSTVVDYYWPDFITNRNINSTIYYKSFSGNFVEKETMDTLYEIMKRGFINRGNMPSVYQGIVKREVLDSIYDIGKTFFPGPSPDIANSVAICLTTNKFVKVDFPIIITGASMMNGGGIKKLKNQVAEIDSLNFLPKNAKENWEKNIPRVWTGETVWPESAIKALRYMKRDDLITNINFDYMLARFILFHLDLWQIAFKLSKNRISLLTSLLNQISSRYFHGLLGFFTRKFFNQYNGRYILKDQYNIIQVENFLRRLEPTFRINNSN